MKVKLDKNMEEFLGEFELSDREVAIYLTLLKTGPNTIMNLARETGIKRSTTHNNVEELIKKGLVSQTNYGERRMVVAEAPDKLQFLLDQKKFKVQKLEKNLPAVIEQINSLVPDAAENSKVEVKYYEGKDGVAYVYDLILKSDSVSAFVNVDNMKKVFPEIMEKFESEVESRKDFQVKDILEHHSRESDDDDNYEGNKHYDYKYLPTNTTLNNSDITIFDDAIALINTDKENLSAVVINSDSLAIAMKNIHQLAWNLIELKNN